MKSLYDCNYYHIGRDFKNELNTQLLVRNKNYPEKFNTIVKISTSIYFIFEVAMKSHLRKNNTSEQINTHKKGNIRYQF